MARTRVIIKQELTVAFMSNEIVQKIYGFIAGTLFEDAFSKVSFENILFDIFTFSVFVLEQCFDQHKLEIDTAIYEQKSGTLRWYRNICLAFQYGFDLLIESDKFSNGLATPEQIEASKIVKYVAISESVIDSRVIIKIATDRNGEPSPLLNPHYEAFQDYINRVKYAGTKITVINYLPDLLNLEIVIYRDPLLIDKNGCSTLEIAIKPVEDAIKNYIKQLPFSGEFVLAYLVEYLQKVPGVKIANLVNASSSWINTDINSYDSMQSVFIKTTPVSGYYKITNFDKITYVV